MNTQTVTLDVTKRPQIIPTIYLGQGDANGTTLVANIYDNCVPLTLTSYDVKLCIQTPNGAGYYECDGMVSGNSATFAIDETYAGTVAGVSKIAYVEVIDGDTVVCSTNRFTVVVLQSAQEGADPSGAYNNGILQAIEDANDAAEAANAAADDANDAAETAQGIIDLFDGEYYASPNLEGDEPSEHQLPHVTECGGTSAEIQSIKGNTVVWNSLSRNNGSTNGTGVTRTYNSDGSVTLNGTCTTEGAIYLTSGMSIRQGDKYFIKGCPAGGGANTYYIGLQGANIDTGGGGIQTAASTSTSGSLRFRVSQGVTFDNVTFYPLLVNLTLMFGAGNEPATVAEFESMFPESYYPYDAGSLLSVNMTGIKTVGCNLLPGSVVFGNSTSVKAATFDAAKCARLLPNQEYYFDCAVSGATSWRIAFVVFDAGKQKVVLPNGTYASASGYFQSFAPTQASTSVVSYNTNYNAFLITANGTYNKYRFTTTREVYILPYITLGDSTSSTVVNNQIIYTSDANRNGEYEPYWSSELSIPASDYFPNGMRSAGTVHDELTKSEAITRIGAVDLGTKNWSAYGSGEGNTYRHSLSGRASGAYNIKSAKFANGSDGSQLADLTMAGGSNSSYIYIRDDSCADADAFKAAVNGVYLYYELATPTTTAIDPPLNLTYKVESGGTESIIKPSGTEPTSAAPTIVTFYAYNADGLRDKALSVVAAIENGKASTNYAVGSYLIHKGTLYKVTSAIASGEEITPGTNVTATTVMAELIALTS